MELKLIIGFIVLFVIIIISILKTRKKKIRKKSKPSKPYSGSSSINSKPNNVYPSQPREQTLSQMVEKLNDSRDNLAVKDITFDIATQKAMYAIKKNKPVAMQTLNLEIDVLINQIEQLIKQANRIAGNASAKNFRRGSENFQYDNELWYRSRLAGVAFLKASDLIADKLTQLHKIDFGKISSGDRKRIKKLQAEDGLISLRRDLLNCAKVMFRLNKNLKELIRNNCGRGGRLWAEKMDKSGEDARFEAKRKQQYGF